MTLGYWRLYNKDMFGFFDKYFLFFGLHITYYGFIIACAMAFGVWLACKNAKFRGLKSDDLIIVACYALPLAIICARLYYVIFYGGYEHWYEIFAIWKGGLAIYGGVIGGALGIGLYCLIHKKNFFNVTDIAVPSLILGQAIGRWGNFFNHEAFGNLVTNPQWQWFPFAVNINGVWHLATFFYESMWNLICFGILIYLLRKVKVKQRAAISAWYLIIYGAGRSWIEGLRTDSLMWGPLRVSQVLSFILIAFGIFLLLFYYFWYRKHESLKPNYDKYLLTIAVADGKVKNEKKQSIWKRKEKHFHEEISKPKTLNAQDPPVETTVTDQKPEPLQSAEETTNSVKNETEQQDLDTETKCHKK